MSAGAGLNIEAFPRRLAKRFRLDFWTSGTLLLAFFIAAPLLAVTIFALQPSGDIWHHLLTTVLSRYVMTTIGLMLGVGIGTLLIGTGAAWLVTLCRFPGRRIFEWGAAFAYGDADICRGLCLYRCV